MNSYAVLFLLLTATALLSVRRGLAPLPLLMGACYMTSGQAIIIGPFHFTLLRLLIIVGFIRVVARGERIPGGLIGLDKLLIAWGIWLLCSAVHHHPMGDSFVFRLGSVFNTLGLYLLIRVFCQTAEDMTQLIKITAVLLVPVAIEMVHEKFTGRNLFSLLGGVPEAVMVRDGKLRAQGPFAHPILAGTVGAVCVPFMLGIWRQHRLSAMIGLAACCGMVIASKSSGPLMTLFFGVFALGLWRWRHLTRHMRVGAVFAYIFLEIVMKDPAYFLLDRIDLTGSSTGWHRAELIRQAFAHLDEWWYAGTDYTRHWMPTGVSWSVDHTDITNHYLLYGVWGGLPLMILFIAAIWAAFRYVGQSLRLRSESSVAEQFLIWSLGAGLFSHAATCVSVAYFDQSVMFLVLNLAAIGSMRATTLADVQAETESASDSVAFAGDAELLSDSNLPRENSSIVVQE